MAVAPSPVPDFFQLLTEAQQASEAVDVFDPSGSPESHAELERLVHEEAAASIRLIEWILANERELVPALKHRLQDES